MKVLSIHLSLVAHQATTYSYLLHRPDLTHLVMAILTSQSWHILKSKYTWWGPRTSILVLLQMDLTRRSINSIGTAG